MTTQETQCTTTDNPTAGDIVAITFGVALALCLVMVVATAVARWRD